MRNLLIIILSVVFWSQAYGQKESRVLEWRIGEVELIRGEQVEVRYPLLVSISDSGQNPQLGTSTIRLFYDAGFLENFRVENIENAYDMSGLMESNNVYGKIFDFAGGGGVFAQFDLLANRMNPLELKTEPVHVLDLIFTVKPGSTIPLCASLVLDNNARGSGKGKHEDVGYLVNDSGIVGTYFLNRNTQKSFLANDEVIHYQWQNNRAFDRQVNHPSDVAGFIVKDKSNSCITLKTSIKSAELLDFQVAKGPQKQVFLNWLTSSEFNNDFFEVQRSTDGFFFETLGRIEGKWNAVNTSSYDFLDLEARDGVNYYRLMQVDKQGQVEYSPIRSVEFDTQLQYNGDLKIAYYPNPSKGRINILASQVFMDYGLLVFDAQGRLVMERFGVNSDAQLDLTNLNAGTYTLTLKNTDREIVSSQSLVITR